MRESLKEIMKDVPEGADVRLVGNNTVEYWVTGDRKIRFHHTDILTFKPDGAIRFDTGGWRTATTLERMNVHQKLVTMWCEKRIWYAVPRSKLRGGYPYGKKEDAVVFGDGMIYSPEFGFKNCGNLKELKQYEKQIREYAKKCVDAMPLPMPDNGDCWYCVLKTDDGKSLGEATGDNDHLLQHVKDGYVVPALVWNILLNKGCVSAHFAAAFDKKEIMPDFYKGLRKQYSRWIFEYLYARIGHGRK